MSCNCQNPNPCPVSQTCICGTTFNIYDSFGNLVESISGGLTYGKGSEYYQLNGSTAFESQLGFGYTLYVYYNEILGRWEMSYYNETYNKDIVIGVYYGDRSSCPISNCWDLSCISFRFNQYKGYFPIVTWSGVVQNGKKSYQFTITELSPDVNFLISWGDAPVEANAPAGTKCWTIYYDDPIPGVYTPLSYKFTDTECPVGNYVNSWTVPNPASIVTEMGVTGFDMKSVVADCGCCDESVVIDFIYDDIVYQGITANIIKDEYGNVLTMNGYAYYSFTVILENPFTFYLYNNGFNWVVASELNYNVATIYAESTYSYECPYGAYYFPRGSGMSLIYIRGAECFDCCNYYTPRFSNFIKKKKYDLISDVSSIKPKEIFGIKCGVEWSDLFRKHLILDVLHCLPYGVFCDEEEQCLINNVNENCNC